jgi:hypothetical protein
MGTGPFLAISALSRGYSRLLQLPLDIQHPLSSGFSFFLQAGGDLARCYAPATR